MIRSFIEKVLIMILAAVIVIITTVTVIVFTTSRDSIGQSFRRADPTPKEVMRQSKKAKLDAYNEIGEIRTETKADTQDSRGVTLLVKPWFSYPGGDTALYEELCQKNRLFRSLISEYFTRYTYNQLKSMGEDTIKEQLSDIVNKQLIMGTITSIYFEKLIYFE